MSAGSNASVQVSFSRASMNYDILAGLHREIGRELSKKLRAMDGKFSTILDVGMGTGWFTNRLALAFPESRVTGLDFAPGMIQKATTQDVSYETVLSDAAKTPFGDEHFDLITSNLAFQWMTPLSVTSLECRRILKNGGVICGTMFGRETFRELFECLTQRYPGASIRRLPSKEELQEALRGAGFKDVAVDYERIKGRYQNLRDLLLWVKGIGANRLEKDFYIGKNALEDLCRDYDQTYRDRFGVFATLEVVWFEGRK